MHRRISGVCTSVRRRPRRARVEGKRSRVEGGGGEGAGRTKGEGGGELERREPSNLVPSRLEVCKNKREERSACHVPRRRRRRPPIADPSRLVAVARKNYPLSRLAAILSGVKGGPRRPGPATRPRFRDSFRRYASSSTLSPSAPFQSQSRSCSR